MLGIPRDVMVLFSPRTRLKLAAALAGSIVQAFAEILAVATVLPLMEVLTGTTPSFGPLGSAADVFGTDDKNTVAIWLAVVLLVTYVCKGVAVIAFRWWVLGFVNLQEAETSESLFRYFLHAPYSLHLQRTTAEFLRMSGGAVGAVYNGVVLGVINVITSAVTIVAILISLVVIMPVPALIMLAYFAVAGTTLYLLTRRYASEAGARALNASEAMFRVSVEPLASIKDIKLKDNSEYFLGRYHRVQRDAAGASRTSTFLGELPRYVLEIVFIVGIALMTVVLFSRSESSRAVSMLALFAVAGFRILPSMTAALASLSSIRVGSIGLQSVITETHDAQRITTRHQTPATAMPFEHTLRLDDLRFTYGGTDKEVLRGVDLDVTAGTSVALVGGSGAGKSTLVDLILGLHTPTGGAILADGQDIAGDVRGWQRNLAVVPQEVVPLDGTVEENVLFGDDPTPENLERVRRAVQQAQLTDLLAELPGGLQAPVGEWGGKLSGGQRQRLGIARALYNAPKLLVLDEATSALDNITEHKITQTMQALHGQITILIVAHRLSTVRGCDQIVFLEDGQVASRGTFEQVRADNAHFARLVELANLEAKVEDTGVIVP
ncbi:ABC transporter ATP-binding protein [Allobranchiibius sp. CTAmp26]|uniref:ABC transporter ATP-binding protein n=1 Tax=Allobranchiibius sp. CTAmp26 TaxID=2815214 RepID=UPI001AA1CBEA|nr:ABC transporter ATP-binding protein [Allobranchiibius sp. CTAmp26]MBO1756215.1 ABC transporter ATP-binding protein [Allobranchiibius sp. CTAmp26]